MLGSGGFGTVYEAIDPGWGDVVALKRLRDVHAEDAIAMVREFRDLADVSHPAVTTVYGLEVVGAEVVLVMEYVPGSDLTDHVGRMSPQALADLASGLFDGLEYLHRRGLLHLDLKPSNVRMRPNGVPALLDFGLVQRFDQRLGGIHPFGVAGTPAYMAPEQLRADVVSPATDAYTLGLVLYEAMTGRLAPMPDLLTGARAPLPFGVDGADTRWQRALCGLTAAAPPERWTLSQARASLGLQAPARRAGLTATPLVGRSAEVAALIDGLVSGSGARVLRLEGPSGSGKTRILSELLAALNERSESVCHARCFAHEQTAFRALEPLARRLAEQSQTAPPFLRIFPTLGGAGIGVDTLLDAFRDLRDALKREPKPLFLVIDDAHWTDPDSAALLAHLLDGPAAPDLRVLLVLRPEVDSAFVDLLREEGARRQLPEPTRYAIRGLMPAEAATLAERLGATSIERIVHLAEGNPFLIEALSAIGPDAIGTGHEVESLVHDALLDLPASAARLLDALAVAGAPLSRRVAAASIGLESPRLLFHALERRRMLHGDGAGPDGHVRTYHDRIREDVVRRVTSPLSLHRGLADALLAHVPSAHDQIALHLWESGDGPGASGHAVLAGERAAHGLAWIQAAEWFGRASAWDPAAPDRLVERRADALRQGGRPLDAAPLYARLAGARRPPDRHDLLQRAGHTALTGGAIDDGLGWIRSLLAELGEAWPSGPARRALGLIVDVAILSVLGVEPPTAKVHDDVRVFALWTLGQGLANVRPPEAVFWLVRTVRVARSVGDLGGAARALGLLGASLVALGPWMSGPAGRCLAAAHRLGARLDDRALTSTLRVFDAQAAMFEGRWRAARDLSAEAETQLRLQAPHLAWERAACATIWLFATDCLGDLGLVRARAHAVLDEATSRGDRFAAAIGAQFEAFGRLAEFDLAGAREQARWVLVRWTDGPTTSQHFYSMRIEAYADLLEGNVDAALHRYQAARTWIETERYESISVGRIQIALLEARIFLRRGVRDGALQRTDRLAIESRRDRLAREDRADGRAHAAWLTAALASLDGQDPVGSLHAAAERFDAADMALDAACCRFACAIAAGTSPDPGPIHRLGILDADRWVEAMLPGYWRR